MRIVTALTTGFEQVSRCCANLPDIELINTESEDDIVRAIPDADALFIFGSRYSAEVARVVGVANIAWIHLITAGIDPLRRFPPPADVVVSSGGRVWASAVAEHALSLLLSICHGLHYAERARVDREWRRAFFIESMQVLREMPVLVVGFGAIGQNIVRLLTGFGARISVIARSSRVCDGVQVYAPKDVIDLLPAHDAIVVTLPFTHSTKNMINEKILRGCKSGTILINVSRGGVIDETAMMDALRDGRLGGAGLDVFQDEPLPQDHPLWQFDNVVLTPHVAGFGDTVALEEMAQVCRENLIDFLGNKAPRDQIAFDQRC